MFPSTLYLPPHHEPDSLHIRQVQRRHIVPIPAPIRGLKSAPRQKNLSRALGRKLSLVADAAALPAVVSTWTERVLEREGEALGGVLVGARHDQQEAVVAGQVEGQLAGGMLRREAGAAEGRGVEVAVEARAMGPEGRKVRDRRASADAIVGRLPEGRVPRSKRSASAGARWGRRALVVLTGLHRIGNEAGEASRQSASRGGLVRSVND